VGFAVLEAFGRGEELHGVPGADLGDTGDDECAAAGLGILRDFNSIPNQYLSRAGSRDTAVTGSLSQQLPNPYFTADAIVRADDYSGNLLRPYPPFGNLNAVVPDGYSRYQSMRLRAERRMIGRMR
jgi:hypothetical protein